MSELKADVKVITEKVWDELAQADPNLHPWAEAEEPERKELAFVVALVLGFAEQDILAKVLVELAEKIKEAVGYDTFECLSTDTMGFGGKKVTIRVHLPEKCAGRPCVIHNPSEHHMRDWTLLWRDDRKMMERLCPDHGTGHPDPDDISPNTMHGCCGCCSPEQLGEEESKPVDEFLDGPTPGVRRVRHQGVSREVVDQVAPLLTDPWMER